MMLKYNVPVESVMPPEQDVQSIKELEHILRVKGYQAKLIGADGEQITIPESVYQVLLQAVHAMALGKVISVVTQERELTTQKAAEFLNVSRPYLIKLLEQEEIPYIKVGSHRRVRFEDLMNYKKHRDDKRSQLLQELIEISEEAGLYEDDE